MGRLWAGMRAPDYTVRRYIELQGIASCVGSDSPNVRTSVHASILAVQREWSGPTLARPARSRFGNRSGSAFDYGDDGGSVAVVRGKHRSRWELGIMVTLKGSGGWRLQIVQYRVNLAGELVAWVCDPGDPEYVWSELAKNLLVGE